jgi:endonuclease/exonuclease/phosphatase family metal-dependent hydrolase
LADFDVLCLQEIAIDYAELTGRSTANQAEHLRELLPGYEIHFGAAVQERGPKGEWRQFGNLIAVRTKGLPVLQVQHYPLPWPADSSVNSMPRMCSVVTVQSTWGPLRIMTTHLEYYSARQRMAQAEALCELHRAACEQALTPPQATHETKGPFKAKPHTMSALLCGDFNLPPKALEYTVMQTPFEDLRIPALFDVWPMLHRGQPHDPTFLLYDRRWGPEPIACDFVFASADILPHVRRIEVNAKTKASDHQPVLVELA